MWRRADALEIQSALALELAKHGVVVGNDLQQRFGSQVLGVLGHLVAFRTVPLYHLETMPQRRLTL